jgi:uncharacterized protein (DUF488 family)
MPRPFFTIGHSTRSFDDFVALLTAHDIKLVVDVRAVPKSRSNPQYNSKEFSEALSEFKVGYQHIAALGGLRGRMRSLPQEANAFWRNQSFHNYADYATSNDFRSGLKMLRERGYATTCVIMCSEAVWWRCHRRIIADYLIASGETVFHILGPKATNRAHLTDGAHIQQDGNLLYPGGDREPNNNLAARR